MPPVLNGPILTPNETPQGILVFLHGFGADGHDLLPLAEYMAPALPPMVISSPHAPFSTPFGVGRQWFSDNDWTFRDRPGMDIAKDALEAHIATLLERHTLGWNKVFIVAFSQGSMTALFAVPRFKQQIGGLVGSSGILMWEEELQHGAYQTPPLLLLHGKQDDVVPVQATETASQKLRQLGFSPQTYLYDGLGHGFNEEGLRAAAAFITQNLTAHK